MMALQSEYQCGRLTVNVRALVEPKGFLRIIMLVRVDLQLQRVRIVSFKRGVVRYIELAAHLSSPTHLSNY